MDYGKAAVDTVKAFNAIQNSQNPINDLSNEWSKQTGNLPKGRDCPRSTFLSVCSAGLVFGVPSMAYTPSVKNRLYGESAVKLLKAFPMLSSLPPQELWGIVVSILKSCGLQVAENHNHQMDVVLGLWNAGLIV